MPKKQSIQDSAAAERILETATELFYQQGYRATGVNEVIDKSAVAKATFYKHFPAKDDLGRKYLQNLQAAEIKELGAFIDKAKTPRDRFLAPIRWILPWSREHKYRGCGFLNIVAEVPDSKHPLRKEAAGLYNNLSLRVKQLAEELMASDPNRYRNLVVEEIAQTYLVIFSGALALSAMYDHNWPIKRAIALLEQLIDK